MAAHTDTHCPYCSLQCGIRLSPNGGPRPDLAGRADFPVTLGGLCLKGAHAAELIGHPDRLDTPLARDHRGAPLRPVSWEGAFDRIVAAITAAQRAHGRDAVACFGGGGLTNEKAYQLGKFARVALGTSAVDYNGRFCMSSAAAAGARAFGIDRGLPFPLSDLRTAGAILLVGSNLAETMPPAVAHLDSARAAGGLLVVDPRRTATAGLVDEGAGVH